LHQFGPILQRFRQVHGLEVELVTTLHTPVTLSAQLSDSGFEKNNTRRLLEYLERVTFNTGETLLHKGEEADQLYFFEMGSVSVYLELDGLGGLFDWTWLRWAGRSAFWCRTNFCAGPGHLC
jgi:CRP-like cAMP-binding protein